MFGIASCPPNELQHKTQRRQFLSFELHGILFDCSCTVELSFECTEKNQLSQNICWLFRLFTILISYSKLLHFEHFNHIYLLSNQHILLKSVHQIKTEPGHIIIFQLLFPPTTTSSCSQKN